MARISGGRSESRRPSKKSPDYDAFTTTPEQVSVPDSAPPVDEPDSMQSAEPEQADTPETEPGPVSQPEQETDVDWGQTQKGLQKKPRSAPTTVKETSGNAEAVAPNRNTRDELDAKNQVRKGLYLPKELSDQILYARTLWFASDFERHKELGRVSENAFIHAVLAHGMEGLLKSVETSREKGKPTGMSAQLAKYLPENHR